MRPKISEPTTRVVIMDPWMKVLLAIGWFVTALVIVFVVFEANSKELLPGPYQAEVTKVYDGDTFTVLVYPGLNFKSNIWPGVIYELQLNKLSIKTAVRVRGVDTPERRGSCKEEKVKAYVARDFVKGLVKNGVTLSNVELGKYAGRVIADVTLPGGRSLTQELITAGLGRPYDGGTREGWCNGL